jgi:hypothetical protein
MCLGTAYVPVQTDYVVLPSGGVLYISDGYFSAASIDVTTDATLGVAALNSAPPSSPAVLTAKHLNVLSGGRLVVQDGAPALTLRGGECTFAGAAELDLVLPFNANASSPFKPVLTVDEPLIMEASAIIKVCAALVVCFCMRLCFCGGFIFLFYVLTDSTESVLGFWRYKCKLKKQFCNRK